MQVCQACNTTAPIPSRYCTHCGVLLAVGPTAVPPPATSRGGLLFFALACVPLFCLCAGLFGKVLSPEQTPITPDKSELSSTEIPKPVKPSLSPLELRSLLASAYQSHIEQTNPHLNFIQTEIVKVKGGYALFAKHTYFNRYSFDIGDLSQNVSTWIAANRPDLEAAQIIRVGVKDAQGYSGSCWLNLH